MLKSHIRKWLKLLWIKSEMAGDEKSFKNYFGVFLNFYRNFFHLVQGKFCAVCNEKLFPSRQYSLTFIVFPSRSLNFYTLEHIASWGEGED
jgi:hypothetical protein